MDAPVKPARDGGALTLRPNNAANQTKMPGTKPGIASVETVRSI
jgi:hypothetical protein